MDYGEDPKDAVIRELREETGVEGSNPISIAVHGEPTRDPQKACHSSILLGGCGPRINTYGR